MHIIFKLTFKAKYIPFWGFGFHTRASILFLENSHTSEKLKGFRDSFMCSAFRPHGPILMSLHQSPPLQAHPTRS